jgi:hypothetical protein
MPDSSEIIAMWIFGNKVMLIFVNKHLWRNFLVECGVPGHYHLDRPWRERGACGRRTRMIALAASPMLTGNSANQIYN